MAIAHELTCGNHSDSSLLQTTSGVHSDRGRKPHKPVTIFINSRLWRTWELHLGTQANCPVGCNITQDEAAFKTADIVVWNARWMEPIRQVPDEISKPRHQKWVFNFDIEPPLWRGRKQKKDIIDRLAPHIDWTFTYKPSSDMFKPRVVMLAPGEIGAEAQQDWSGNKSKLLLWFVSNCGAKERMQLFRNLTEFLPRGSANQYGKCGEPDPCHKERACKKQLSSQYKFYAAFENTRCDGYITEKLVTAYDNNMVPIVWGGLGRSDYERLVPGDSFIHVDDFKTLEQLAEFMLELDRDASRYNAFFAWKKKLHVVSFPDVMASSYCKLCTEAQKPAAHQIPTRAFGNLSEWWFSSCL